MVRKTHALMAAALLASVPGSSTASGTAVQPLQASPTDLALVLERLATERALTRMEPAYQLRAVDVSFRAGPSNVVYTVEYHWRERRASGGMNPKNECVGFAVSVSPRSFRIIDHGWGMNRDGGAGCRY